MKIGLVIPPSSFLIDDRAFAYLGPLQVAALAREAGHEVEVLDLTGHSRICPKKIHAEECAAQTLADSKRRVAELARRSDMVGFYSMAALHHFVSKFLPAAREGNGEAATVLGGPHASTAPDRCAAEGWDYIVVSDQGGGGGEPGFMEVVRLIAEKRRLRPGSLSPSFRPGRLAGPTLPMYPSFQPGRVAGSVIRVASRDATPKGRGHVEYANDRWPYPARDLIDFESYRYTLDGRRFASVVTQTGCPFRCSFCSHWGGYTTMGLRSPAHVEGEIREVTREYPWVGGIMFYDDEINLRPDFWDFLDTLKRLSGELDLRWRGFWKSGKKWNQDDALFDKVKAAGFDYLCTGAESADPEVLRLVGKGATLEDNTAFVRQCARVGIKMKLFTQVGLPGERPESAERNARWLENMAAIAPGLIDADVTITTPTSGTPLYEQPERFKGLIEFDRAELDSNNEACNYKGIPGQYKSFVRTPWLTREDIVWWRDEIEGRFRKAAGLPALVGGKDDG